MKILVILPKEGFEEVEAVTTIDYLRRAEIEVTTVALHDDAMVMGSHNIPIKADLLWKDIDFDDYQGIILPGGLPGAEILRDHEGLMKTLKKYDGEEKLIAAICAAPIALGNAGVLENRKYTCYPGVEKMIKHGEYTGEKAIRDGHVITGKGPALAINFALEIVEYLADDSVRKSLASELLC